MSYVKSPINKDDIPEGYLTMANYKEPLKKVENGYGYYGVLLVSTDGQYAQCHICGNLYAHVGAHVRCSHKIKARDYKNMFMLAPTTALVSEDERMRLKQGMLDYLKSLTPEQRAELRMKGLMAYKNNGYKKRLESGQPKKSLEQKNKEGTCPDQLLDKIKEVREEYGRTPSMVEFMNATGGQRFKHLIITTFGSWGKALDMLGFNPKKREKSSKHKYYYSNEELLEYLSLYARENLRLPTDSDCKRGLLPAYSTYQSHFGSFDTARKEAGVYKILREEGVNV